MDIPELLISAAELGVTVSLAETGESHRWVPVMTGRTNSLPADLRAELRARKSEIQEYLNESNASFMNGFSLYVSKSLKTRYLPDSLTGCPPCLLVGSEPFYRLTPDVLAWMRQAVERGAERMTAEQFAIAYDGLDRLAEVVRAQYPPHVVRMACRSKAELPPVPETVTVPDWPEASYFAGWKAA